MLPSEILEYFKSADQVFLDSFNSDEKKPVAASCFKKPLTVSDDNRTPTIIENLYKNVYTVLFSTKSNALQETLNTISFAFNILIIQTNDGKAYLEGKSSQSVILPSIISCYLYLIDSLEDNDAIFVIQLIQYLLLNPSDYNTTIILIYLYYRLSYQKKIEPTGPIDQKFNVFKKLQDFFKDPDHRDNILIKIHEFLTNSNKIDFEKKLEFLNSLKSFKNTLVTSSVYNIIIQIIQMDFLKILLVNWIHFKGEDITKFVCILNNLSDWGFIPNVYQFKSINLHSYPEEFLKYMLLFIEKLDYSASRFPYHDDSSIFHSFSVKLQVKAFHLFNLWKEKTFTQGIITKLLNFISECIIQERWEKLSPEDEKKFLTGFVAVIQYSYNNKATMSFSESNLNVLFISIRALVPILLFKKMEIEALAFQDIFIGYYKKGHISASLLLNAAVEFNTFKQDMPQFHPTFSKLIPHDETLRKNEELAKKLVDEILAQDESELKPEIRQKLIENKLGTIQSLSSVSKNPALEIKTQPIEEETLSAVTSQALVEAMDGAISYLGTSLESRPKTQHSIVYREPNLDSIKKDRLFNLYHKAWKVLDPMLELPILINQHDTEIKEASSHPVKVARRDSSEVQKLNLRKQRTENFLDFIVKTYETFTSEQTINFVLFILFSCHKGIFYWEIEDKIDTVALKIQKSHCIRDDLLETLTNPERRNKFTAFYESLSSLECSNMDSFWEKQGVLADFSKEPLFIKHWSHSNCFIEFCIRSKLKPETPSEFLQYAKFLQKGAELGYFPDCLKDPEGILSITEDNVGSYLISKLDAVYHHFFNYVGCYFKTEISFFDPSTTLFLPVRLFLIWTMFRIYYRSDSASFIDEFKTKLFEYIQLTDAAGAHTSFYQHSSPRERSEGMLHMSKLLFDDKNVRARTFLAKGQDDTVTSFWQDGLFNEALKLFNLCKKTYVEKIHENLSNTVAETEFKKLCQLIEFVSTFISIKKTDLVDYLEKIKDKSSLEDMVLSSLQVFNSTFKLFRQAILRSFEPHIYIFNANYKELDLENKKKYHTIYSQLKMECYSVLVKLGATQYLEAVKHALEIKDKDIENFLFQNKKKKKKVSKLTVVQESQIADKEEPKPLEVKLEIVKPSDSTTSTVSDLTTSTASGTSIASNTTTTTLPVSKTSITTKQITWKEKPELSFFPSPGRRCREATNEGIKKNQVNPPVPPKEKTSTSLTTQSSNSQPQNPKKTSSDTKTKVTTPPQRTNTSKNIPPTQ